jgi:hypothetical protein
MAIRPCSFAPQWQVIGSIGVDRRPAMSHLQTRALLESTLTNTLTSGILISLSHDSNGIFRARTRTLTFCMIATEPEL